jgi:SPP1 family predicted phage head-tail adaptor
MQAGKLRHEVEIQSLVPVQDGTTGEITETWETFAVVWGEVRPASVREFIAAGISESTVTAQVTIRYRPDIKASMRVLHGAQVFNIEGALPDPKSGVEYLTLPCSEVQSG